MTRGGSLGGADVGGYTAPSVSEDSIRTHLPQQGIDATLVRTSGAPREAAAAQEALFAGRYELLGQVGRGGMGTVYRARDTLVGDVVALKVLEVGEGPGPELLERFRREVRLARRISHPHVARTHDLGEHAGRLFLTMEFVEGADLQSLLRREGPQPATRAARIALAVCDGLSAAHAAGVVHRDLKPANVLVEASGRVALTDFGIARAVAGEAASRTQGLVGTPMYMAPEQLSGGEVGARADLYAVGLLLYELLTAEPPFSGESSMAVAFARLRQPPPDPRGRVAVPEALAELVLRCLAREPEERPSGALEVASALRGWLASMGEQVEAPAALVTPVPGATTTGTTPLPASPPTGWGSRVGGELMRPTSRTLLRPGEHSLAVLPLRFVGPRDLEYLGDTLTEGLIDVLSRMRGLKVQGSGATERFRTERDPRVVARELGVGVVVDGTVQSLGPVVRASLRLLAGESGTQLWSGRFEESGADAFVLQDRLGQRMAEALRNELLILSYQEAATPEGLALYRKALAQVHTTPQFMAELVIAPLEECIARSPGFLPAVALHALATMRTWFMRSAEADRDWAPVARASLERAVRLAPELAETLLARAMLATQEGEWRKAVLSLRAALDAAPTCAAALHYLGNLQCEAGRADEGLERLRLAYALEPALTIALLEFARCSALRGKMEDFQWASERLMAQPFLRVPAILTRMRVFAWTGQLDEVRRCRELLREEPSPMASFAAAQYATSVLGEEDPLVAIQPLNELLGGRVSPRFASMLCQFATEQLCLRGHAERALEYFQRAADTALIDLEWTDRCPALAPLRALPGFAEGRRKVRARVEDIWTA